MSIKSGIAVNKEQYKATFDEWVKAIEYAKIQIDFLSEDVKAEIIINNKYKEMIRDIAISHLKELIDTRND